MVQSGKRKTVGVRVGDTMDKNLPGEGNPGGGKRNQKGKNNFTSNNRERWGSLTMMGKENREMGRNIEDKTDKKMREKKVIKAISAAGIRRTGAQVGGGRSWDVMEKKKKPLVVGECWKNSGGPWDPPVKVGWKKKQMQKTGMGILVRQSKKGGGGNGWPPYESKGKRPIAL